MDRGSFKVENVLFFHRSSIWSYPTGRSLRPSTESLQAPSIIIACLLIHHIVTPLYSLSSLIFPYLLLVLPFLKFSFPRKPGHCVGPHTSLSSLSSHSMPCIEWRCWLLLDQLHHGFHCEYTGYWSMELFGLTSSAFFDALLRGAWSHIYYLFTGPTFLMSAMSPRLRSLSAGYPCFPRVSTWARAPIQQNCRV